MGRAERRRQERAARIQSNKDRPVRLSHSDLKKLKQEAVETAIEGNAEVLFNCFALAMHEQCGFGRTRINRVLAQTDEYFGLLARDELQFSEIQRRLHDEVGLEIGMED